MHTVDYVKLVHNYILSTMHVGSSASYEDILLGDFLSAPYIAILDRMNAGKSICKSTSALVQQRH